VKKQISVGLRLGTMLLDHALICVLTIPIIVILSFNSQDNFMSPYSMIPVFTIYFCKDCIDGRSLAKRILKLQVVDNKKQSVATPFQNLIRNIFILIWPVEVIVSFFNQERRIGDRVAGTKLNFYIASNEKQKNNIGQTLLCLIIASLLSLLLMIMFSMIS